MTEATPAALPPRLPRSLLGGKGQALARCIMLEELRCRSSLMLLVAAAVLAQTGLAIVPPLRLRTRLDRAIRGRGGRRAWWRTG